MAATMPTTTARAIAADVLGDLARLDVPLAPFTTYKVGGPAALFVRATERTHLGVVAEALAASGLPLLVVGRGSNLLVHDDGFAGIALSLADLPGSRPDDIDIDIDVTDPDRGVLVTAGSAVALPMLARRTVKAGLAGFEWAVGVPGSIGGAVRMNAGGHGSDMAASLVDVDLVDLVEPGVRRDPVATVPDAGSVRRVPAADLGLRFRGSGLAATAVVLSARLGLRDGDVARGERELSDIVAWRRAHQPGGQNAGSVFVNPVPGQVSAGELIDAIGLRGMRLGSAAVSDKHANFIQADADGSANDVVALMRHVRARVLDETGYALRSEIRLIGFGEDPWV